MKWLSTKTHGTLDYLVGVFLMVMPWLFGFANGDIGQWIPMAMGGATIVYSFFTNYELGIVRIIPMKVHLLLDLLSGILLAASPWLFGFAGDVWAPHLALGLIELAVVAISSSTTGALDHRHAGISGRTQAQH